MPPIFCFRRYAWPMRGHGIKITSTMFLAHTFQSASEASTSLTLFHPFSLIATDDHRTAKHLLVQPPNPYRPPKLIVSLHLETSQHSTIPIHNQIVVQAQGAVPGLQISARDEHGRRAGSVAYRHGLNVSTPLVSLSPPPPLIRSSQ
jgi:hypothetical protein